MDLIQVGSRRNVFSVSRRIVGRNGRIYSIQDQLGAGGNAIVCECADEADGSIYAVKLLASRGREPKGRFSLEQKLLEDISSLRHDHLIRFITSGECDGEVIGADSKKYRIKIPFIIMERARCSLREFVMEREGRIGPEIYAAQFRGLVAALELLHQRAVHRDIKPENILVVGERWVISDFGLCAPLERSGGVDLTSFWQNPGPRYWMSPEANNRHVGLDDEVNFSSDIFQMAAVFWWVVNRRHPTGILVREDWDGMGSLYGPISTALQHSQKRRYSNAKQFGFAVIEAINRRSERAGWLSLLWSKLVAS